MKRDNDGAVDCIIGQDFYHCRNYNECNDGSLKGTMMTMQTTYIKAVMAWIHMKILTCRKCEIGIKV